MAALASGASRSAARAELAALALRPGAASLPIAGQTLSQLAPQFAPGCCGLLSSQVHFGLAARLIWALPEHDDAAAVPVQRGGGVLLLARRTAAAGAQASPPAGESRPQAPPLCLTGRASNPSAGGGSSCPAALWGSAHTEEFPLTADVHPWETQAHTPFKRKSLRLHVQVAPVQAVAAPPASPQAGEAVPNAADFTKGVIEDERRCAAAGTGALQAREQLLMVAQPGVAAACNHTQQHSSCVCRCCCW